jgi:hypothetical protein
MRQQFIDATGRMSRQPFEYILEIAIRIVAVELRGLSVFAAIWAVGPRLTLR